MRSHGIRVAAGAVCLSLSSGAWALAQVADGEVRPYSSAGLRDYSLKLTQAPMVHTEVVESPGAQFVRIEFDRLNLAPGDTITITNPQGTHREVLRRRGPHHDGHVWSFAVPGSTALVTLNASPRPGAPRIAGHGYAIKSIVHGWLPLTESADRLALPEGEAPLLSQEMSSVLLGEPIVPKSICGDNGFQNVACQATALTPQRSVARLLFINSSGGRSVRCTGWLVRGANSNTLVTNNHCFSTAAAVRSTEAQFNYQTTACAGTALATTQSFRGNQLLRTRSGALDYTLMTMLGNPEATWGELIPLRRQPATGERIWVIQHPAGQPKKIGHWEDAARTRRCDVESLSSTQVRYSCDTQGGSSGSVVLAAGTNLVLGLHHLGGCPNQAAKMANICADAGALLSCQ